jgi:hypothetical protein
MDLMASIRPLYRPLIDASPTVRVLSLLAAGRIQRSTQFVREGYEDTWGRHREALDAAKTIEDWLYIKGIDDVPTACTVDGKVGTRSFDWSRYNVERIGDELQARFSHAQSLTEYGCGVGRNLLRLKLRFPKLKVYGYELAAAGVEIARRAAQKFGVEASYAELDYVQGTPQQFVFPATDVAMTVFSLEQVPYTNMIGLKNMLDRVKMGTIHLEPVSENYPMTYRGLLGRIYSRRVNYLSNFDAGVRALRLKNVSRQVLTNAHNPLMYPSLYVLET